jgi:ribosomal protein L24
MCIGDKVEVVGGNLGGKTGEVIGETQEGFHTKYKVRLDGGGDADLYDFQLIKI